MPEVVIVDEIGTEAEALACRSIAERGVQLIGTAHGQILENLMKNPTLSDLIGGIQSVTLGAQPAMDCQVRVGGGTSPVMPAEAGERPCSHQLAFLSGILCAPRSHSVQHGQSKLSMLSRFRLTSLRAQVMTRRARAAHRRRCWSASRRRRFRW